MLSHRFIRTKSWKDESEVGARLFRPLMNAEGSTFLLNAVANLVSGGAFLKDSANTALVHFAGRTLALQDTMPPWELDPERLTTLGACNFENQLPPYIPFTAHPKVAPLTGDLVFLDSILSILHTVLLDPWIKMEKLRTQLRCGASHLQDVFSCMIFALLRSILFCLKVAWT